MKHKASVLITATYHPKPGSEERFLSLWKKYIRTLAKKYHCTSIAIYHNETTEEFIASGYWPTEKSCRDFLHSNELLLATRELSVVCLVPPSREIYEIYREAAA